MVAGIRHNHISHRVERQARGAIEATGLCAWTAPTVEQRPILGKALYIVAPLVADQEPALWIEDHRVGPDELTWPGPVRAPHAEILFVPGDDADAQPPDRRVKDVRAAEDEQAPVIGWRHIVRIVHAASELDKHTNRLAVAIETRDCNAHGASHWPPYTNANCSKLPLTMGLASTWNQRSRMVL